MRTLIAIHTAETRHFSQFGKFAGSLPELASAGETLPGDLARTGDAAGYRFTLFLTARGYAIHANPIKFGTDGGRTFFSDETLEIHRHYGPEPATATDPLVK